MECLFTASICPGSRRQEKKCLSKRKIYSPSREKSNIGMDLDKNLQLRGQMNKVLCMIGKRQFIFLLILLVVLNFFIFHLFHFILFLYHDIIIICKGNVLDVLIIIGERNAQIGKDENDQFCLHNMPNKNEELRADFSLEHRQAHLNTKFQKRQENNSKTQLNYIFINKK